MRPLATLSLALCLASSSTLTACGSSSSGSGTAASSTDSGSSTTDGSTTSTSCTPALGTLTELSGDTYQTFEDVTVGSSVSFTVPASTASVTLILRSVSAPVTIVYSGTTYENAAIATQITVTSADGGTSTFYDDDADNASYTSAPSDPSSLVAYSAASSAGTSTMTFPNTSTALTKYASSGLPAGTWTATIADWAMYCSSSWSSDCASSGSSSSTYDVTVIQKAMTSDGGIPSSGNLSLKLNLLESLPSDGGSTALARLESTLATIYDQVGVTLDISVADVSSTLGDTYATLDVSDTGACSALAQLFEQSTASQAINVFLVPDLTESSDSSSSSGTTIAGIDGTIPGPSTLSGTRASGVVVGSSDLTEMSSCTTTINYYTCGPDFVAYVTAHEIGHYLGLFHTTEASGEYFDPLSDTAQCRRTLDGGTSSGCGYSSSIDGMPVSACLQDGGSCGGGDNLMFWLIASQSQGLLTSQQGQVMRANPTVWDSTDAGAQ